MKPKQQNNPAVLGILGIAFLFILVRIFKTLTSGAGEPLSPAKPNSAAQQAASAAGTSSTKFAVQSAVMRTRDPFDHPYLVKVAQEEAAKLKGNNGGNVTPTAQAHTPNFKNAHTNAIGLPTVAPPAYGTKPILSGFANSSGRDRGTGGQGENNAPIQNPNDPMTQRPNDPTEKWRVTAILGGSHPTAVLESPAMSPRTVAVGDELQGFRIAAIRSREIVVASARTVLTLPLETHGDNGDNTIKIEPQENKETKTLTAIQPPKSAEKPHEKSSN